MLLLRSRSLARRMTHRAASSLPSWATIDPEEMSGAKPAVCENLVGGEWTRSRAEKVIIDPLNGEDFLRVPDTQLDEIDPFVQRMLQCPRTGLHNPLKNPERYPMLGDVNSRAARALHDPEVAQYFMRLIQRVAPKHDAQAMGEVITCRKWFESYSADQVRNLARSFALPGDHVGQQTNGYRWPFGATSVITPFNFPLEIPLLQSMSSVFMGNQCTVKVDWRVSAVMEQMLRLLHDCGLPETDMDFIHCDGPVFNDLLVRGDAKMTLFTGSQHVAEKLTADLKGKVKLEDAGFDWKILGPDPQEEDYVVWQSDQDAYAFSGQKCSAQSMLFIHENWAAKGFEGKLKERAALRTTEDLSICPVLSWNNTSIKAHIEELLKIPGARVAFGGNPIPEGEHSVPSCYGIFEPTAVFVPIEEVAKPENFDVVTRELFGPFQVITEYRDDQLPAVLDCCERLQNHLTAAVVSNDAHFNRKVLATTINGTTYAGIRARTTGAPQNHWFGPAGDPRAAGIHTAEAIRLVWSCHREVIDDYGPVGESWAAAPPS